MYLKIQNKRIILQVTDGMGLYHNKNANWSILGKILAGKRQKVLFLKFERSHQIQIYSFSFSKQCIKAKSLKTQTTENCIFNMFF